MKNDSESRVALSLRTARGRLGWSRETLAHQSGVSFAAITQIESGRRKDVRLSSLAALATALEVSTDYLIGIRSACPPQLLEHQALFYRTTGDLLETALPFLADGLDRSEAVLAVTSSQRIGSLRDALGDDASRVEFAESSRWYTTPAQTLARYRDFIDRRLAGGAPWIFILGEPVWARRSPAQRAAWTRYESLLNVAFAACPVTIVCPYNTKSVGADVLDCAAKTHPETTGDTQPTSPSYLAAEHFLLDPAR